MFLSMLVLEVLVENGTKDGHQMLMEARDALVKVLKCSTKDGGLYFLWCWGVKDVDTAHQTEPTVFQKQEKIVHDPRPAFVFAPVRSTSSLSADGLVVAFLFFLLFLIYFFYYYFQCPHEMMCPKLAQEPITPCNFQQLYHPLPLPGVRLNCLNLNTAGHFWPPRNCNLSLWILFFF